MADQLTIDELIIMINDLKSRIAELEKNFWMMSTGTEMPENTKP